LSPLRVRLSVEQISQSLGMSEVKLSTMKCPPCELARFSVPHPDTIDTVNIPSQASQC
jgi:hypothetical protein